MTNKRKFIRLNIETLVLVAVWEQPFIFQGCFKIVELDENKIVLFFFRCQANHPKQVDILQEDFSPHNYEFTHLYNEQGANCLNFMHISQENALYILKYALHITLKEMLVNQKLYVTSIDDKAMQAMINKITPILNKDFTLPEEDYIGFAVAIDFCPQEEEGINAALALLKNLPEDKKH